MWVLDFHIRPPPVNEAKTSQVRRLGDDEPLEC